MGIFNLLEIGRSGLLAQQDAMQTTSNNINNVNTPNYSRQRPQLNSRAYNINFGYRIGGGGVEVGETVRIHDQFVQRQLVEESKNFGNLSARATNLQRVEGLTFEGLTDLNERANDFFNHFRELSVNPELPALRVSVKESANSLAHGFRKTAESLEGLRTELDLRVAQGVDEVNRHAADLADLNRRITAVSASKGSGAAHALMDRRDGVVKNLARLLGVNISSDERGQMNVVIPGVGILVHGGEANQITASRTPGDKPEDAGNIDIFLKGGSGFQYVTKAVPGGELGGLLEVRDRTINQTIKKLDKIAFGLQEEINKVHQNAVSLDWETEFVGNFFETLDEEQGASARLQLNESLDRDPTLIAAGFDRDAPSDNRVALEISDLQHKKFIGDESNDIGRSRAQTLNESISSIIGEIGTQAQGSSRFLEHQSAIMDQLENYQKSVSGVSLEEEAVNMMQFQTAFNAAAKTMQVGDELLATIMSIGD